MDWKQLIERGETPNVDFKAACKWEGEDRVRLTKAIVAMANTRDGGMLLIGIDDDRVGGRPKLSGLSPEQIASFDPTKLGEYINERFEPKVRLRIEKPDIDGYTLVAVVVHEFDDQPHICVKEAPYQGKPHFKPGDLLVRTAAAQSSVAGPQELRDLLARALTRRGEHLLEHVRRIVIGAPPTPTQPDWRELLSPDLNAWAATVQELRPKAEYGGWEFTVVPTNPPSTPLAHADLADALRKSAVSLRGWDFPHHQQQFVNRTIGISMEVSLAGFIEHWELSRRLLFSDFRSFFEDRPSLGPTDAPGTELNFVSAIYTLAEFVLFTKRLYAALGYEGNLVLRVALSGCRDRKLVSKDSLRWLNWEFKCIEPEIAIERGVHTTDLAAGWEEIVVGLVVELFALFNWTDPSREMILSDIAKLRDRKV